jgi:hypothetical protein
VSTCTYVPFEPKNSLQGDQAQNTLLAPEVRAVRPFEVTDGSTTPVTLPTGTPSTAGRSSVGSLDDQCHLSEFDELPGRVDLRDMETIYVERAHWATSLSQVG